MKTIMDRSAKNTQRLSLKLAFLLLPLTLLLAGFAMGMMYNNIVSQPAASVSLFSLIVCGSGALIALAFCFIHYSKQIDAL